ncbi:unnamed protein product [Strongylus vulgaris]|uniref:Uncharacterized protein n=1 Tax=Strongylus vulgaris TaxID=40348 RepID=A0A3P7JHC8_STRVU|nr:unnamed protein product [Strongylus vulgaris]
MELEEDHRIRPELPVVDLEEEVVEVITNGDVVVESPAPKKRKEESITDDCIILDDSDENQPCTSTPVRTFEFAKPEKLKKLGTKRTSKLPWNPLEATFHIPESSRKSGSPPAMEKLVDLTIEEKETIKKKATLRDVLGR